ncbi:SMI1/KNR4 family protein [Paenibacillus sp. CAU 1782]
MEKYSSLYNGASPYSPNPALSEDEVRQFEKKSHIILPPGFRDFLLHIGNGGKEHRKFPLPLSEAADPLKNVFKSEELDWTYMSKPFIEEQCNYYYLENEAQDNLPDDLEEEEYDRLALLALQGTLAIYNDGCGYYDLLIVSGELAGKVISIDTCHGQGFRVKSPSFEHYFVNWMKHRINERQAQLEHEDIFACKIAGVKLGGSVRDLAVVKKENGFSFQFELFAPGAFAREGEHSTFTLVDDEITVSLYMEHRNYKPLEWDREKPPHEARGAQLTLVGDRSEHVVFGEVKRLFRYHNHQDNFPLFVHGLDQEILIKGLSNTEEVKVGDWLRIKGRLNGDLYQIKRV